MTNLCGHERDVLILALGDLAHLDNDILVRLAQIPEALPEWRNAVLDLVDPAKLAEMLAERGRELGLPCDTDFPATSCIEEDPTLVWRAGDVGVVLVCDDSIREFAMPQARTILLQWLQLPDGAREEAERRLRGET